MTENIDTTARRRLAYCIRTFCTGRIRARKFEALLDDLDHCEDPGVRAVVSEAWYWYDDFEDHKFSPTTLGRRMCARCYLFLLSEAPYRETTDVFAWWIRPLQALTLGLNPWSLRTRTLRQDGPWPFSDRAALCSACQAWEHSRTLD